jgi:hypothetical protein
MITPRYFFAIGFRAIINPENIVDLQEEKEGTEGRGRITGYFTVLAG